MKRLFFTLLIGTGVWLILDSDFASGLLIICVVLYIVVFGVYKGITIVSQRVRK